MTNEGAPAARGGNPAGRRDHEDATRRAGGRRALGFGLIAIWVVAIGLLFFIPPSIGFGSQTLTCRALGPGTAGGVTVGGFPSNWGTLEAVNQAIASRDSTTEPDEALAMRLGASEFCTEARTNQQTLLTVVLAAGLAVMLGIVIRNQRRTLARASAPGGAIETS